MQGTHCAEIASRSSSFRKTNFASDHAVADRLWEPKTVIFDKAALLTESRNLATLSDVGIMATAANAHKVLDTCTTRKLGSASMADAAKELNKATSAITIIPKAHELFAISCAPNWGSRCCAALEMEAKNVGSRNASRANDQAMRDKVCACAWSISLWIFPQNIFINDVLCTSNFANAQLMFEMCCCVYSAMLRRDSTATASIKGKCKWSCFAKAHTVFALSWAVKLVSFPMLFSATAWNNSKSDTLQVRMHQGNFYQFLI